MKPDVKALISGSVINTVDDRNAMALPSHHVRAEAEFLERHYRRLAGLSPEELVAVMADDRTRVDLRYAAGTVLALVGDPRLRTQDPAMVKVAGGLVLVGLDPRALEDVFETYRDTGILREWIEKETPRHAVEVGDFRIGKYPVTNQEYRDFLLDSGFEEIPSSWQFGRMPDHAANRPVYTVSAAAADAYARWLSAKTGRSFRLPSEAEWELAAAGPEGREFPWGDAFEPHRANTREAGFLTSTPVGMFPAGATLSGIHDLAGNVEEYVADDYAPYPGGPNVRDDLVEAVGRYRVARGGSFTRFRDLARCRRRHGRYLRPIYVMGFRLAEDGRDEP